MPINKSYEVIYTTKKEARKHAIDKIMELKKYKKFYIGATSNPEERLLEHISDKKMNTMYILCRTPTKHKTKILEKSLIKRFYKLKNNINDVKLDQNGNIIQGGGGEGITEDTNYIYVLFR